MTFGFFKLQHFSSQTTCFERQDQQIFCWKKVFVTLNFIGQSTTLFYWSLQTETRKWWFKLKGQTPYETPKNIYIYIFYNHQCGRFPKNISDPLISLVRKVGLFLQYPECLAIFQAWKQDALHVYTIQHMSICKHTITYISTIHNTPSSRQPRQLKMLDCFLQGTM